MPKHVPVRSARAVAGGAAAHLVDGLRELLARRRVTCLAALVVAQLPSHRRLEQRPRLPPLALHDEDRLRVLVRVERRAERGRREVHVRLRVDAEEPREREREQPDRPPVELNVVEHERAVLHVRAPQRRTVDRRALGPLGIVREAVGPDHACLRVVGADLELPDRRHPMHVRRAQQAREAERGADVLMHAARARKVVAELKVVLHEEVAAERPEEPSDLRAAERDIRRRVECSRVLVEDRGRHGLGHICMCVWAAEDSSVGWRNGRVFG